jgi:hypothetical protein
MFGGHVGNARRTKTMNYPIGRNRSLSSFACLALLSAFLPLRPLYADDAANISAGNWVRVTTGSEVTGEGFSIGAREPSGKSVSEDKRTMTFGVNGQAVRVAKPNVTLEGAVDSLTEETLVLRGTGESSPIVVSRHAITHLDVRRRQSWKVTGLLIGALAGGVIGGVIGASQETESDFLHGLPTAGGAFVGTLSGALLGVLVAPGAKWEKDVSPVHVQISLRPARRGVRLAVVVGF